ncbi:response regulator [Muricoccus radiodurans]|uniref:response regulator n=1 Tax=Muricoccus radiodurans TaxID=2231721 RepID=UPI003CF40EDC
MSGVARSSLHGCRILVVEDEYFLADELAQALQEDGAEVLGPVARVADALPLIRDEEQIDGALLDVNLAGEMVWPAVEALLARSVPIMLATGYDDKSIPPVYAHLPRVEKPLELRALLRTLRHELRPD